MKEYWIVKGVVTNPDIYLPTITQVGDIEWQFSDGPAGERGFSSDFLSLEEGLAYHSPAIFYYDPTNE